MPYDFSAVMSDPLTWAVLSIIGLVLVFIILRFFLKHVLKFLFHGCVAALAIIGILAILHYFRVF